ncbi:unnamed protein product [Clonostachys rosea f. rosea IK726]|uniref:Uncharacterized protein n=1 Tax=Clonostachys rosea f. rosea IK726 TaxID=1349383 RepID=A0ACA9UAK5_BIOOC|nr:unnamed protein product [Clonostachys rosea f. rosea IK726]
MPVTTIRSPPSLEDYVPLAEYQSQTPETFIGGKPVLHYHLTGAKATIPKSQCGGLALFPADSPTAEQSSANGETEELVEQPVTVFVNSETFTIFSDKAEAGASIPYPSISIHAIKQVGSQGSPIQAVWLQLEFADGGSDDDDFNTLYEAVANCSNLHPDPNDDEEEDEDNYDRIIFEGSAEHEALAGYSGVLRGAADGGGWITADNVHEYFDEDGNWIGEGGEEGEALGDGAGRTRGRNEVEAKASMETALRIPSGHEQSEAKSERTIQNNQGHLTSTRAKAFQRRKYQIKR